MDRRGFIGKAVSTAVAVTAIGSVKPMQALDLMDGKVKAFDMKPGHYVLFFSAGSGIDVTDLPRGILPKDSTGGWAFVVNGPIDDAVRIFRLE